jgi:hypothetical protein
LKKRQRRREDSRLLVELSWSEKGREKGRDDRGKAKGFEGSVCALPVRFSRNDRRQGKR